MFGVSVPVRFGVWLVTTLVSFLVLPANWILISDATEMFARSFVVRKSGFGFGFEISKVD